MIEAEKQCRRFNYGEVAFSAIVNTSGAAIRFYTKAIQARNGAKISSRLLTKYQRRAELLGFDWKHCDIELLFFLEQEAQQNYDIKKAQAKPLRDSFFQKLAEENHQETGKPAEKNYKIITQEERQ